MNNKLFSFTATFLLCFCSSFSQTYSLWKQVPDAIQNDTYLEVVKYNNQQELVSTSKVTIPTLTAHFPKNPNGTAVVICPGGGYRHLAFEKEGTKVARWFNELGITAFVLKYRLPSSKIMVTPHLGPLQDAQEAIRWVKNHASQWELNPDKIGVLGFSAGGHLVASLLAHYNFKSGNKASAKPNFGILIYPVISMEDQLTHTGSKRQLLGENPKKKWINFFSIEKQVHANMPPIFMVHAQNDTSVVPENSYELQKALNRKKISNQLIITQDGGHGFGLGTTPETKKWTRACEQWMRDIYIISE